MHVVIGVPLYSEEKCGGAGVPRVLLCDWLVDSSCISLAKEAVVLDIVCHFKEEDADCRVSKLEQDSFVSE